MTKKETTKAPKLAYANTDLPIINAIILGLYSFRSKQDAQDVLLSLREKFIISKTSPKDEKGSLILWIRGYEVQENEKNFVGNYANITIDEKSENRWTLSANKIPTVIKFHPQRVYEKSQHPNWGHPILRGIKKKRIYETVEEAGRDLQYLQEDYPKTAIPAPNKLYLMVYEQAEKDKKGGAVKKYTLEIKSRAVEEHSDVGGFFIDFKVNETVASKPTASKTRAKAGEDTQPTGRFTSMVALRRNKKKPAKSSAQVLSELLTKKDK